MKSYRCLSGRIEPGTGLGATDHKTCRALGERGPHSVEHRWVWPWDTQLIQEGQMLSPQKLAAYMPVSCSCLYLILFIWD